MSIYGDNVVNLAAYNQAKVLSEQLSTSDYIQESIKRVIDETGAMELDDSTAHGILKFQSRQLLHRLFEISHLVLNEFTADVIRGMAPKDKVQMVVGLIGRIATLTDSLTKLEEADRGSESEWMHKLHSMPREAMLDEVRRQFARIFGTLFTDEEREHLFGALERDYTDAQFGTTTDNADGESVGSTRWHTRSGSAGILPTAQSARVISSE